MNDSFCNVQSLWVSACSFAVVIDSGYVQLNLSDFFIKNAVVELLVPVYSNKDEIVF